MTPTNSGTIFDPKNDYLRIVLENQSLIEPEEQPKEHHVLVTATVEFEFDRFGLESDVLDECSDEVERLLRKGNISADFICAVIDKDGEA